MRTEEKVAPRGRGRIPGRRHGRASPGGSHVVLMPFDYDYDEEDKDAGVPAAPETMEDRRDDPTTPHG